MAVLTASRVVLERVDRTTRRTSDPSSPVTFAQEQHAENAETQGLTFVRISREMYEDMGSPMHVTVTVEAGDTLNA